MLNEFIGLTAVMGGITEERHNLEAQPGVSGNLARLSRARYPFSWLRLAFEFGVNCLLSMTRK
jgi:hypothetical protein